MQNADELASRLKVLVALRQSVEVKSVSCIRQEYLRLYLGVDGLAINVRECKAKNKRAQVIDVCNAAEISKRTLADYTCIAAPLILRRGANAAIQHSGIAYKQIRPITRAHAEFAV